MTTFVLATANPNKAVEMRRILGEQGIEVLPRPEDVPDVDETEDTLEGNALLKARAITAATLMPAVADDTGLFVDALHGRPGVYSARYAGEGATNEQNVAKVLDELSSVAEGERSAHFRSVIAVSYPDGTSWWVEGVLEGSIVFAPTGTGGFGYDSVFAPNILDGRTLGETSPEEKGAISHRGQALRAFAQKVARS
jgi:XTP/dITP diphosphohydrolase